MGRRSALAGRRRRAVPWTPLAGLRLAHLSLLSLLAFGCARTPHRPTACTLRAPAGEEAMTAAALIPVDVWADLLAPDHRERRDPLAEIHDCSGAPLTAPSLRGQGRRAPRTEIDERSITLAAVDDDILLWLRLLEYDDGDALGVLALLSRHGETDDPEGPHLEVRAVGTLRAPADPLELRVEPLAAEGDKLVLARGRRCPEGGPCVVEIQLIPWIDGRFVDVELRAGDEEPAPARILLHDRRIGEIDDGWRREAEIRRRVRAEASSVTITETLQLRRCPAALPEGCEEEATVHRERPLDYRRPYLEIGPSLWPVAGLRPGRSKDRPGDRDGASALAVP